MSKFDPPYDPSDLAIISHIANVSSSHHSPALKRAYRDLVLQNGGKISAGVDLSDDANQRFAELLPPRRHQTRQKRKSFTFIDLFAGIGGFRIAMESLGGECVFSSEWDVQSQQTYFDNHREMPFGDITLERTKSFVPATVDVICAGFPCQAFSIAGQRLGFDDTRGTLFFEVAELIRRHKPSAVLLENVKGLQSHNKGDTLKRILRVLRGLGYFVPPPEVVNAADFGVPQSRERIFIVAIRRSVLPHTGSEPKFIYPKPTVKEPVPFDLFKESNVEGKYYLSSTYLRTLERHRHRHKAKGNGFGYSTIKPGGLANALVVGGMGLERNLLVDPPSRGTTLTSSTRKTGGLNECYIRKLTPRECARLQGFPWTFVLSQSDTASYRQFGNSVAIPAVRAVGLEMLKQAGIEIHPTKLLPSYKRDR